MENFLFSKILWLTLTWFLFLVESVVAGGGLLEYADLCSKHADSCNPDSDLRCDGKACTCNWGTFYDRDRKHCVVPIGGMCKYSVGSYRDAYAVRSCPAHADCENVSNEFHGQVIPESVAAGLVQNGNWHQEGLHRCACAKGHGPDPTKRKCEYVLQHGESCTNNKHKCESSLVCGNSGTCDCADLSSTYFDTGRNKCVIRLGEKCKMRWGETVLGCEQNAICSSLMKMIRRYGDWWGRRRLVRTKTTGNEERCVCAPGFTPNSQRKCTRSFHVGCSEEFPCNADSFLTCVNGACQCEQGTTEVFVEDRNASCYILPGSPCSENKGPRCVENAICRDGHCTCGDGFLEKSDKCLLTHGKKCRSSGLGDSCNYFHGLACISSKCACFDSSLDWNPKLKRCTAKEGGRCGKINFSESETDILHRGDHFYPLVTLATARAYFDVGCGPGSECKPDEEEIYDRKHCRKEKTKPVRD